jgi:hypothetical protein
MSNKHEAREPDMKLAVWAWSEPDTARHEISGPSSDMKLGTMG